MKTIDESNINQAVAYANLTAYKSAKRYLTYRICLPICSTLFFLFSVILAYGAVERFVLPLLTRKGMITGIYRIPVLSELWTGVFAWGATVWYRFAAMCVVLLFVVPVLVALVVFFIVSRSYHPDTSQSDIHTYENNIAGKLYQKAKGATEYRWVDARWILPFSLLFFGGAVGTAVHIMLALEASSLDWVLVYYAVCILILFGALICGELLALYASLMYVSLQLWERIVGPRKNAAFVNACEDYWQRTDPVQIRKRQEAEKKKAESERWQKEQEEKKQREMAMWKASKYWPSDTTSSGPSKQEVEDMMFMDQILKNMPDDWSKDM